MRRLLVSCSLFLLIDFTESIEKIPYKPERASPKNEDSSLVFPGRNISDNAEWVRNLTQKCERSTFQLCYSAPRVICNFESYNRPESQVSYRYFCVPDSACRNILPHSPLMHYEGCGRFMHSPNSEKLVCCYQSELQEDFAIHFTNISYLPGVRSFMMCKEFSHTLCGPKGSYCDGDVTEPEQFDGLPTSISKYPHTALIGYFHSTQKVWHWFCQGSIVSKTYILTAWSCMHDGSEPATNVKIGESRICAQAHCPDRDEEQNLVITLKSRYGSDRPSRHDLALVQVSHDISFNKNVRPACLYYELNTRQAQGWFARYGKPDRLIKTYPGERPLFMSPKDKNVIAFRVKTAGEAKIMFSKTGLPYKKEFYYEIVLGAADNADSMITRSDAPNYARPPTPINITTNILSSEQFRGFWITFKPHEVFVGKEDSKDSFLWYADDAMDFNLSAMGISTSKATGEWIINDSLTLSSLHDFEMLDTETNEWCEEAAGDTQDPETNDDSTFCAISAKKNFGPCDNDWGGAIQIVEDDFYCMWQIFGVFIRDGAGPTNCSQVRKPSLFKLLNNPGVLTWIEEIIFPDFIITDICLEEPTCIGTNTSLQRHCIKPI